MAGVWRSLVLVVVLTAVTCEAHRRRQSYESIVNQAVQFFNQGRIGQPLFRLLEATPPSNLTSPLKIPLNFRIKETVCLSTQGRQQPQDCAFREGGEERNCVGVFQRSGALRFLNIDCSRDLLQQQASRKKRSAEADPETSTKLPPVIRDMYEKAKYDIIFNILRNF